MPYACEQATLVDDGRRPALGRHAGRRQQLERDLAVESCVPCPVDFSERPARDAFEESEMPPLAAGVYAWDRARVQGVSRASVYVGDSGDYLQLVQQRGWSRVG